MTYSATAFTNDLGRVFRVGDNAAYNPDGIFGRVVPCVVASISEHVGDDMQRRRVVIVDAAAPGRPYRIATNVDNANRLFPAFESARPTDPIPSAIAAHDVGKNPVLVEIAVCRSWLHLENVETLHNWEAFLAALAEAFPPSHAEARAEVDGLREAVVRAIHNGPYVRPVSTSTTTQTTTTSTTTTTCNTSPDPSRGGHYNPTGTTPWDRAPPPVDRFPNRKRKRKADE